jgi:hypothetical protein
MKGVNMKRLGMISVLIALSLFAKVQTVNVSEDPESLRQMLAHQPNYIATGIRMFLLFCLVTVLGFEAVGHAKEVPSNLSQASQSQDGSLLKPEHRAYMDAMEFALFLNQRGINVKSVHRSKLESLFPGIEKAAFFKTEKGVVEVIFFPDPRGAESVTVTEQRKAGRYLYSFEGQPNPKLDDAFDSSRPMYFLMHRNWFIVLDSDELYDAVKSALKEE